MEGKRQAREGWEEKRGIAKGIEKEEAKRATACDKKEGEKNKGGLDGREERRSRGGEGGEVGREDREGGSKGRGGVAIIRRGNTGAKELGVRGKGRHRHKRKTE